MTTYHVHVITGTEFGSGTNANVFVKLYGDKDQTGIFFLSQIFIILWALLELWLLKTIIIDSQSKIHI